MKLLVISLAVYLGYCLDLDLIKTEHELMRTIEAEGISSISSSDIEVIVNRLYFDAASLIIRKAHSEKVDVSGPVRTAVNGVRSKLDHLVKLLDPEYSIPQRVPPAFQWTQNDTSIFIQLKYSRRFNAPGAVDVSDFNCTFTDSSLIFSAIGGHSGKRFEYALNLDFFDAIVPNDSSWNIGSVGKVLLTIAKRVPSKWPRLLLANSKIDNMHYWHDFGEKMETSLKPLPILAESSLTCRAEGRSFCPTSGKCVQNCSGCKSKPLQGPSICRGSPAYKPKDIVFSDTDQGIGKIRGPIEVQLAKEYHRYDVQGFNIYVVPQGSNVTDLSNPIVVAKGFNNVTSKVSLQQTEVDSTGVDLIAIPFNDLGENRDKQFRKTVTDLFRPDNCSAVDPLIFEDTDATEGQLKGLFRFVAPTEPNNATHLVFHWGKSESEKLQSSAVPIAEVSIGSSSYNLTSMTIIPSGASHILVFAKSAVGESSGPIGSWAIKDRHRPKGKVEDIRLLSDRKVEFKRLDNEADLTGYTIRQEWKNDKGRTQTKDIEVVATAGMFTFSKTAQSSERVPDAPTQDNWKVCVYVTSALGTAWEGSCVEVESVETTKSPSDEL
jgi:hypothetical protein